MSLLSPIYYVSLIAIAFVAVYIIREYKGVKALSEGPPEWGMSELAGRIRKGSQVFIKSIFKVIIPVAIGIAILLSLFVESFSGLAFLAGLVCTSISVIVGMSVGTYTNVRAAATALANIDEEENVATTNTVNTTIKGGKICGLIVHASSVFALIIIMMLTGTETIASGRGIVSTAFVIPVATRITAYSLGWSIVAMFCRVPGGIFTKAADIGADLIGKVVNHFKEDDPKNPAVIADQVGDNVNDIAANEADLGESFTATPVTAIVTAINAYGLIGNRNLLTVTIAFPLIMAVAGLISSLIGLVYASNVKNSKSPKSQLNTSMLIAAGGAVVASFIASLLLFGNASSLPAEFKLGWGSPFVSTVCGIVAGVAIGFIAQHFTDLESKWCIWATEKAKQGSALYASFAQAAGWISCFPEISVVAVLSWVAWLLGGPYGQAVMALGMLCFVAQPISADAFGPISDNAGGIAEGCHLPEKVRIITDKNDATGNETAAVGKGFAIGSCGAVVLSQISTFMHAGGETILDLLNGHVMLGLLLGAGLMGTFCGLLAKYTLDAADEMAAECRKQLNDKDVKAGKKAPDYKACIRIATESGLRKMIAPVAIAVGATVLLGFTFGIKTLGGFMSGLVPVGLVGAVYFSNAGGLADNGKKRFEAALVKGYEPGTEFYNDAHDAATIGDTIGDWMKDVVAVCIDIFMKIVGILGIMLAPIFAQYNLFQFLGL